MLPDAQILEDVAIELGVDPSFIEKDWYAVKVLAAIAAFRSDGIVPVFSGGTCLSKAYKLLQRFSEDLDFRAHFVSDGCATKTARRNFREGMLAIIEATEGITLDRERVESGSSYFKVPLSYERLFENTGSLRPDLQVEFSYTQPRRKLQFRTISSFVAESSNAEPETRMLCLSPIETAADKFSALTWRILKRNRDDERDDPSMIRHLHDLCALRPVIFANTKEFSKTAIAAFQTDMSLSARNVEGDLSGASRLALEALKTEGAYVEEYERFVASMSYATKSEIIHFKVALGSFGEMIGLIELAS